MEKERQGKPVADERDGQDSGKDDEREDFEQLAIMVAASARSSVEHAGEPLPSQKPDTPERWISNLAEGYCRDRPLRREQAVEGIRAAFETKYGMTPEAYVKRHDPGRRNAIERAARHEAGRRPERETDRER